jgi:hypothetical protein
MLRRLVGATALLVMLGGATGFAEDTASPRAAGTGRVTIVYQEDKILPENREAMKQIRDSGVFERMVERLNAALVLPHDLEIVVTDDVPAGFDDPTTEADGTRIYWPAAFSRQTYDILAEFLPEVIGGKGIPAVIARENFTAGTLNVWGNLFILGHELGHAIIHQLTLPLTGLEEDSADGFAIFFTLTDPETGPNATLGAAVLFEAIGSKRPTLTLEDFSSDHAVIMQRVFNFLCAALGSDRKRLDALVTDGYIPKTRAALCTKEWAQLEYGWWTALSPHLSENHRKETEAVRARAGENLAAEMKALADILQELRLQQQQ